MHPQSIFPSNSKFKIQEESYPFKSNLATSSDTTTTTKDLHHERQWTNRTRLRKSHLGSILVTPSMAYTDTISTRCAADQGLNACPASYTDFWHHPKGVCHSQHAAAIQWTLGCSIHRGIWDQALNVCQLCEHEKTVGVGYPVTSIRQTYGYPGDDLMN
jgi:hypothetical protein